jgi:hypothetical protein
MVPISSATVQQRLVETQERAMDAQVQQCVDRKHDFAHNSEEYLPIRLHSSSMLPSYVIMELDIDVPDEVYYHPLLEKLRYWGFILICIDNVSICTAINDFTSDNRHRISFRTISSALVVKRSIIGSL